MAELSTLVPDIYALFDPDVHHEASEENLDKMADTFKQILRDRLAKQEPRSGALRFSSLGKPDRQLWYEARGTEKEAMPPKTYFKFIYGDLIEALLLFLAKEAGHSVTDEQREVEVDGVKGHIDAIIDGVVVDAKSASPFGYRKLETLGVLDDDPFGYVAQLAGYGNVLTPEKGVAWLVADKVGGDLCTPMLSASIVADNKPEDRITHLKEVLDNPEPPPRCYSDKPEGKSGNRALATGCSYCGFRNKCWPGLRTFLYSTGPKHLTVVAKKPEVRELIAGDTDNPEVTD